MVVELIRDGSIGTPAMNYAKLRSGPVRVGSTPFCAIYETGGAGRTLIMRRGAASWEEADALAGAPHVALFPESARLYYAHGASVVEMDEAGAIVSTIAGPTVSGLYYPFAVARAAAQLAVLYSPNAAQAVKVGKLWLQDAAEQEAFPAAPDSGTGTFPVSAAVYSGGLHMAAAAGAAPGYAGGIWYRSCASGLLGALHLIPSATPWFTLGTLSVTSDGKIYLPFIDSDVGHRVKVAKSTVAAPETWETVDVGPIAWGTGLPDIVATLAPDNKTLHLFWTEDPNGDGYMQDCYEAHGKDGVFSAAAKLIGIDEFPVIQDQAILHVEGAGVVASSKIGVLFSAGYGIGDTWHTYYGEVAAAGAGGSRYRGWVM